MRIKETRQFAFLLDKYAKLSSPHELSERVLLVLGTYGLENIQENYGSTVDEHCKELDIDINQLFIDIFQIKGNQYDRKNLSELILIGDGDCPECGGYMSEEDAEYKQSGGFDYDSEPEYEAVWRKMVCPICGNVESDEQ